MEAEEGLKLYQHAINDILREKAHVLSKAEENLLAQMSEITGATNDVFTMINNADINSVQFWTRRRRGGSHPRQIYRLHGSHDRRVRKEAYEHMYKAYTDLKNTLATNYNYKHENRRNHGKDQEVWIRQGSGPFRRHIPLEVYDNLIDTVNSRLDVIHRSVEVRRKMLALDEVHMYDMYVPLVEMPKEEIPYEKALDLMREGLSPLGEDYLKKMNAGIEAGWIDVFENEGKTSGAYSFGSYDSMPYILLNYNGKLKDVFTIVHEMGHSMHSYYTRHNQPFVYGGHSIFTAEVASTVNEALLMNHMLSTAGTRKRRIFFSTSISRIQTQHCFRQTMFAEFEKLTHAAVESGEVLTAECSAASSGKLNKKYYGDKVRLRIPDCHGMGKIPISTAHFMCTNMQRLFRRCGDLLEDPERRPAARDAYIEFLKTGESDYPIELSQIAGVDIGKPDLSSRPMDAFEKLVWKSKNWCKM
jgi:oligoendopeptidase F